MERKINKVKLFVIDERFNNVKRKLENELKKYNFELVDKNYELGISIGGDGSFLGMVKETKFASDVYYIGINAGTLGFLQEIDIDETDDFVKRLNENLYKVEELSIQETKVITGSKTIEFHSLNEIVVRNKSFDTLRMPIYVDDELLEDYSGDGLLISTSTGSTAYNMSFGGAIVYNTLRTLSITPIAPLKNKAYATLSNTVIIPDNKIIKLMPKGKCDLFMMADGVGREINDVKQLETTVDNISIKCLRMYDFHFIKVIHTKLLKDEETFVK